MMAFNKIMDQDTLMKIQTWIDNGCQSINTIFENKNFRSFFDKEKERNSISKECFLAITQDFTRGFFILPSATKSQGKHQLGVSSNVNFLPGGGLNLEDFKEAIRKLPSIPCFRAATSYNKRCEKIVIHSSQPLTMHIFWNQTLNGIEADFDETEERDRQGVVFYKRFGLPLWRRSSEGCYRLMSFRCCGILPVTVKKTNKPSFSLMRVPMKPNSQQRRKSRAKTNSPQLQAQLTYSVSNQVDYTSCLSPTPYQPNYYYENRSGSSPTPPPSIPLLLLTTPQVFKEEEWPYTDQLFSSPEFQINMNNYSHAQMLEEILSFKMSNDEN